MLFHLLGGWKTQVSNLIIPKLLNSNYQLRIDESLVLFY